MIFGGIQQHILVSLATSNRFLRIKAQLKMKSALFGLKNSKLQALISLQKLKIYQHF